MQGAFLFARTPGIFETSFLERMIHMGVYEELQARGLIAQVTNEEEIREVVNNGKAVFYIGLFPAICSRFIRVRAIK